MFSWGLRLRLSYVAPPGLASWLGLRINTRKLGLHFLNEARSSYTISFGRRFDMT